MPMVTIYWFKVRSCKEEAPKRTLFLNIKSLKQRSSNQRGVFLFCDLCSIFHNPTDFHAHLLGFVVDLLL